jgi:hypothetical protein
MLVFLDDSGDPGFKIRKGSSPCFVIALVIFGDDLEAERCAVAIKELRRALRFSDQTEFRFSHSSQETRLAFLARVAKFDFRIRAIVMDKTCLHSPKLRGSKESFYRYAIKMVLKNSFGTIRKARLKIDGHGDREFRRELQSYLRRELMTQTGQVPVLSDLKIVDSQQNVLIQLADMVAGTIRRHAEGEKSDAALYRAAIKSRIENVWNFGRGQEGA